MAGLPANNPDQLMVAQATNNPDQLMAGLLDHGFSKETHPTNSVLHESVVISIETWQ